MRYRFTARMTSQMRWPEMPGALLRSVLGLALRGLSCITGASECRGCGVRRSCSYSLIFDLPTPLGKGLQPASNIPNPYVIEPGIAPGSATSAGELVQFNIVLVGSALRQLGLVIRAVSVALQQGLGQDRVRADLLQVDVHAEEGWIAVWRKGDVQVAGHPTAIQLPSGPAPGSVVMRFLTPLRLQQQGMPLGADALTPRKLLGDLLRRTTMLFEAHDEQQFPAQAVGGILEDAAALVGKPDMRWVEQSRYSSRQGREMALGGLVGQWRLEGELGRVYPWLWLGQWLHLGKNATMGNGRYLLS